MIKKIYICVAIFGLGGLKISAQINSLLSANEKGLPKSYSFSANRFMGAGNAAYNTLNVLNTLNPASYAYANLTSIDFGVEGESVTARFKDSTKNSGNVGLSHLAFLFPIIPNQWGLAFGIHKTHEVNYKINAIKEDARFGKIQNIVQGSGNLYNIFVGSGYRIQDFSFGGNLRFEFGNIKEKRDFKIVDSSFYPKIRNQSDRSQFNIAYNFGVQYHKQLNKKNSFGIGAYYLSDFSNSGTNQNSSYSIFVNSAGREVITDLENNLNALSPNTYTQLGIGAQFTANNTTTFGAEFTLSDYSAFKNAEGNNLQSSWELATGIEFKPFLHPTINTRKYFNRVTYRFGGGIGKSAFNVPGNINEFKVRGALSLPVISRTISTLTLGTEYQMIGFDSKAQSESFFKIFIQIAFADRWFIRSKFD
jgi:hypothetical protein